VHACCRCLPTGVHRTALCDPRTKTASTMAMIFIAASLACSVCLTRVRSSSVFSAPRRGGVRCGKRVQQPRVISPRLATDVTPTTIERFLANADACIQTTFISLVHTNNLNTSSLMPCHRISTPVGFSHCQSGTYFPTAWHLAPPRQQI